MSPRLKQHYRDTVVPALRAEFKYENVMQIPRLERIVLNTSIKEATSNVKRLETAAEELSIISGQKAQIRRARKSIANFKLRAGSIIGTKVTLRGPRMWAFLDRLLNVALPRVRDFRGVSPNAFDGRGNYTLGLKDQLVFPEIEYDKIDKLRGLEVTIVTTAPDDDQARALLTLLGMPFTKKEA